MTVVDELGPDLDGPLAVQRRLWSADPEGWSRFSEPHTRPLFEAVLDAARVGAGDRLLDLGCGTGLLLQLAAARGAAVSGVDVSATMLGVAGDRLPDADLRIADLQHPPFPDGSFDVVTAVNAFQFAVDPPAAIRAAARLLRPGGRLVIGSFAEPERAESTVVHLAMAALSPARAGDHAPYALSEPDVLAAALAGAGLRRRGTGEVVCVWAYDRLDDVVRGLTGSGGGTRAVEDAGADAVREVIEGAVVPFTDPVSGRIAMRNVFRWVLAEPEAS